MRSIERHKFDLPPTLVDQEFNNVWPTIENDLKQQGRTFADEGTTEEKPRADYRGIAERRVRLGLVIAEIGEKNNIKVTRRRDQARRDGAVRASSPGRSSRCGTIYRKNPNALASLRAPIYEEKVVDFLLELAARDRQEGLARGALQGRRGRGRRRGEGLISNPAAPRMLRRCVIAGDNASALSLGRSHRLYGD